MSTVATRWRARLATRRALLAAARRRHEWNPTSKSRALVDLRKQQVAYAERVLARHTFRPRVRDAKLEVTNVFGPLGKVERTIGHYTAGPRDETDAHALFLWRQYHGDHMAKGWGGIGYHYGVTKAGTVVLLRPVVLKGVHTAQKNTGSVGIVVHGGPGQTMTDVQHRALAWLYDNAHTRAFPKEHRSPVSLRRVHHGVHKDYNATACPGSFEWDYKNA